MITKEDIGRRVIVNGTASWLNFNNEKGKIIGIVESVPQIAIEFDKPKSGYHSGNGIVGIDGTEIEGKNKRVFYVHEENITFEKERKKMTGIRIETEKIVESDGNLSRKITGFKALNMGKLPAMYLEGKRPICYIASSNLYVSNRAKDFTDSHFLTNEIVTEEKFQKLLEHCRAAGDHLMDVNRELKKKKAEWNGKETFVI